MQLANGLARRTAASRSPARILVEDDTTALDGMSNLACALAALGETDEPRALLESILATRTRLTLRNRDVKSFRARLAALAH